MYIHNQLYTLYIYELWGNQYMNFMEKEQRINMHYNVITRKISHNQRHLTKLCTSIWPRVSYADMVIVKGKDLSFVGL